MKFWKWVLQHYPTCNIIDSSESRQLEAELWRQKTLFFTSVLEISKPPPKKNLFFLFFTFFFLQELRFLLGVRDGEPDIGTSGSGRPGTELRPRCFAPLRDRDRWWVPTKSFSFRRFSGSIFVSFYLYVKKLSYSCELIQKE